MVQLCRSFFFENAKNLGWSDDAKRRKKKRMALVWIEKIVHQFPLFSLIVPINKPPVFQ